MYFTQQEICKKYVISPTKIMRLRNLAGIKIVRKLIKGHISIVYTEEDIAAMGLDLPIADRVVTHELVTNPKFLELSYFPDITPKCFIDD